MLFGDSPPPGLVGIAKLAAASEVLEAKRSVEYFEIGCRSVLNRTRPGMPFEWSLNPYRGCEFGCRYCYARYTHEFMELRDSADFEDKIYAKSNLGPILKRELKRVDCKGGIAIGTATDPYQPLEGRYRITRGVLEELARARTSAHLITRSPLVVRDIDVLGALSRAAGVSVCISLPTLDEALARKIEPTVAPPRQRLRAVRMLAAAGIRVGVAVAPILPHLTDGETSLRNVFAAAADAGASMAWHNLLNLNEVARESYFGFLRAEFPSLVAGHETYYRRKYAPKALTEGIDARVRRARSGIRLRAKRTIAVAHRVVQLSLLEGGVSL